MSEEAGSRAAAARAVAAVFGPGRTLETARTIQSQLFAAARGTA